MKTLLSVKRRMPLTEAPLHSGAESFAALPACALLLASFLFYLLSPPPLPQPPRSLTVPPTNTRLSSHCPPLARSAAFAWANLRFDGVFALRSQARVRMCRCTCPCPCTAWRLALAHVPLIRRGHTCARYDPRCGKSVMKYPGVPWSMRSNRPLHPCTHPYRVCRCGSPVLATPCSPSSALSAPSSPPFSAPSSSATFSLQPPAGSALLWASA
jgi:hypothetical protein